MTDSAGVRIAQNTAQGMWSPGEEWTLQEDLRIGRVEGVPELQFGQIVGLDVDQAGRIYVLDQQAQEVRVFSPAGEYLRSVGQAGGGPGELSASTQAVFVAPDQTLRVVDAGHGGRVTTFGPDGEYISDFRLDRTVGAALRWDTDASARLFAQLRVANTGLEEAPGGGDRIVIYDIGDALDTLYVLPRVRNREITIFGPEPLWDLDAGVLLTAVTTRYRVETRNMEGQLIGVLTKEVERRPLTESDRSAQRRAFIRDAVALGMSAEFADRFFDSLAMADFYPALGRVLVGPMGSVMVQRVATVDDIGEDYVEAERNVVGVVGAPEWDIFDELGRYLGPMTFPERFQPFEVVDDLIYGVGRDELGVQFVMRLRVTMPTV